MLRRSTVIIAVLVILVCCAVIGESKGGGRGGGGRGGGGRSGRGRSSSSGTGGGGGGSGSYSSGGSGDGGSTLAFGIWFGVVGSILGAIVLITCCVNCCARSTTKRENTEGVVLNQPTNEVATNAASTPFIVTCNAETKYQPPPYPAPSAAEYAPADGHCYVPVTPLYTANGYQTPPLTYKDVYGNKPTYIPTAKPTSPEHVISVRQGRERPRVHNSREKKYNIPL